MSFASYVSRVFGKRPVWLYRISTLGLTAHLTSRGSAFISGNDQPTTDFPAGQLWASAAIQAREITRTTQSNRATFELMLPTSHAIAQAVLGTTDPSDVEVTVWQTFANDPDEEFVEKFNGRVVSFKPGMVLTRLNCEEGFTKMSRSSVAQVVQRPCRHAHYVTNPDGGGCRLVLADWQTSVPVSAVDGRSLTIPAAALQPDGTFTAGILEFNGVERFVEDHVGASIKLEAVMPGLAATDDALIAPGCALTTEACDGFDNIDNFGGFPWMTETPFDGRSIA
jgi:hypothetical protein